MIADEIQSGLARSGRILACDWENVRPDVVVRTFVFILKFIRFSQNYAYFQSALVRKPDSWRSI